MVGESGSFGQLERLGQVWKKYERNGEVCAGRCEKMY